MRKKRHKKTFAKLGLLFTVIIISLAGISAGYAHWTDTITINTTINSLDDYNFLCLNGCWTFNDTSEDSSIYNNNGVLQGNPLYVSGKVENALSFDGDEDYVEVSDDESLDIQDEITVMSWVKVNSLESGRFYTVAGKWNDRDADNRGYLLGLSTKDTVKPQPKFYISSDGNDYPSAYSSMNLDTGIWYHLAGTFDGSTLKIYVNGELKGTQSFTSSINLNDEPVLIAGDRAGGGNGRFLNAILDEVRIYSCALDSDEILEEYQEGL